LPAFDPADLTSVRRAFQFIKPCLLQQAWLDDEEAGFSPGTVRVGSCGNSLVIFAELADADIFNDATTLNQRTWELGDVLEIFLGSLKKESYIELQVTPGNQRLQLRYSDAGSVGRARKTGEFQEFLIPGDVFQSRTWVDTKAGQWNVFAEIPGFIVCGSDESIGKTQWRFSFGRYDYTRGVKEPVISSTSPHVEPDFHRRHEWGVITFKMPPELSS
jgi:hypothetical protein